MTMKELEQRANAASERILKKANCTSDELVCPREKSEMTPCIARDGALAIANNGKCVGCGIHVDDL